MVTHTHTHTSRCTSSSSKIFQHLQIRLILLSHLLICIFLFFRRCPGGGVTRPFLQEAAAVLRAVWFPGLRCRPEGKGDQTCGAERAGRECGHQQRSPHRASVPRGYKDGRRGGGGKKNKSKCWGVFFSPKQTQSNNRHHPGKDSDKEWLWWTSK